MKMNKKQINAAIQAYINEKLSLTDADKDLIQDSYLRIQKCLPNGNICFLTGSYARRTAIHPLHDLDIIYPIEDKNYLDQILHKIKQALLEGFQEVNEEDIELNSHSISMKLSDDFSVDIVPAVELNIPNEYGQPLHEVPEIFNHSHVGRAKFYKSIASDNQVDWIKSDPRGYIEEATQLNELTGNNARFATKLLKASKNKQKESSAEFKLKSFHLEQIATLYYKQDNNLLIIKVIQQILKNMAQYLNKPCIKDKADNDRFIDEYVNTLSGNQKNLILEWAKQKLTILDDIEFAQTKDEVYRILDDFLSSIPNQDNAHPRRNKMVVPPLPYTTTTKEVKIKTSGINEQGYQQFLDRNYPGLKLIQNNLIEGELKFRVSLTDDKRMVIDPKGKAEISDSYHIRIAFYQSDVPKVYELGGRIRGVAASRKKNLADMHQYPNTSLCLAHPLKLKNKLSPFNLEVFIDEFVVPYFAQQSYFAQHGEWPFGELLHDELGCIQYIGAEENAQVQDLEYIQGYLEKNEGIKYLKKKPRGHKACLCLSGKKLRDCHPALRIGIIRLRERFRSKKVL